MARLIRFGACANPVARVKLRHTQTTQNLFWRGLIFVLSRRSDELYTNPEGWRGDTTAERGGQKYTSIVPRWAPGYRRPTVCGIHESGFKGQPSKKEPVTSS